VERPRVVIISDETGFAQSLSRELEADRNPPSILVTSTTAIAESLSDTCDLVIVGGVRDARYVLKRSCNLRKPVLHVSQPNGHSPQFPGVIPIPEVDGWPVLVGVVARQILERERAAQELTRAALLRWQLEREASLGRYMLEMRHNLNNALTSILGNSELMLQDSGFLSPNARLQTETIRNMGMRMNEIFQRFSSLRKEMQLVEQQASKKAAKATVGV